MMKFRVKEELLQLFRLVGATGETFTFLQLMDFLRDYIKLHKLYDPADPVIIDTIDDPLGKIFKTSRFSVARAQALLKTCLLPVIDLPVEKEPKVNVGEAEKQEVVGTKRKESTTEGEPPSKRVANGQGCSPIYIDIVSGPEYDSSPETVLSIQGYDTAAARDTGDESFVYDEDDDDITQPNNFNCTNAPLSSANSEYDSLSMLPSDEEVGSSLFSDNDYSFEYEVSSVSGSIDSDSDTGSTIFAGVLHLEAEPDDDIEFWADLSNCEDFTSDDWDPDITDCDKWLCKKCSCLNWPTMRFCQKCWQLRNNWLPEHRRRPPKRLRRKRRRSKTEELSNLRHTNGSPDSSEAGINLSLLIKAAASGESDGVRSQSPTEVEEPSQTAGSVDEVDDTAASSQGSSKDSADTLCILCLQRPRNASLIHGASAHMLTCFHCARKLWQQGQPCPACRRKVQKIVRTYMQ